MIFASLGLFSPTVLLAKLFLHKLILNKYDWDDSQPIEYENDWKQMVTSMGEFSFNRYILINEDVELHCFCNAPEAAKIPRLSSVTAGQRKTTSIVLELPGKNVQKTSAIRALYKKKREKKAIINLTNRAPKIPS